MNSTDENDRTKQYVAEIKSLYKSGDFRKVLWTLHVFKHIPDELHKIAIDTITRTAGISPSYYKAGLNYLTWKSTALPLNSKDRERLLSVFLDIAADPERQVYITGNLQELSKLDDPRGFKLLVTLYQNDTFPESKKKIAHALGAAGKENALPILLDHIHQHKAALPGIELNFLEKYPVSQTPELLHAMDVDDRDQVVVEFITYLQNAHDHNDALRITMAYALAILYASDMTSLKSKELIKASAHTAICHGYDEYNREPTGYVYLKEFITSGKADN
jgi:hypothetical protein